MSQPFELRVKFGKKGESKLLSASIMDGIFEDTFCTSLRLECGVAQRDMAETVFRISPEGEPAKFWHSDGNKVYAVLKSYVDKGALPDPAWKQPLLITQVRYRIPGHPGPRLNDNVP